MLNFSFSVIPKSPKVFGIRPKLELRRLRVMQALLTILFILLTTTVVADSAGCPEYDRKSYRHWIDEDRDCQNARHEVLIEESLSTVGFKSSKGCRVVSGSWNDPYSGRTITDASKLDIDHMVPP